MRFAFIAKHRHIWPVAWLCNALDVSRSGFHAWLNRSLSARSRYDEVLVAVIDRSFKSSDRTYGARRVWHDVLAEGLACGLHRVERLMRENGLRARPREQGDLPRHAAGPVPRPVRDGKDVQPVQALTADASEGRTLDQVGPVGLEPTTRGLLESRSAGACHSSA